MEDQEVLVAIIRRAVSKGLIEPAAWEERQEACERGRRELQAVSDRYPEVVRYLEG